MQENRARLKPSKNQAYLITWREHIQASVLFPPCRVAGVFVLIYIANALNELYATPLKSFGASLLFESFAVA